MNLLKIIDTEEIKMDVYFELIIHELILVCHELLYSLNMYDGAI